ncbi:hypothetical protein ELQ87_02900 [Streptomyces griseoviridis]|uniref:Uncharacterized protein n=1 Tax=Streptomyces griseoviridis TaxID=45398 RepID=A0A3S9Z6Q5_STRGD|nr:hypothetical protein ELQ87_02900 [Streptomyces griseoviridis]QCN89788.1 hypothetical protein DDJ31_36460 [Streptomyces griseoviridis]
MTRHRGGPRAADARRPGRRVRGCRRPGSGAPVPPGGGRGAGSVSPGPPRRTPSGPGPRSS